MCINVDLLQGELKKREQISEELKYINSLLEETEVSYASGEVYRLRQEQEAIKAHRASIEVCALLIPAIRALK